MIPISHEATTPEGYGFTRLPVLTASMLGAGITIFRDKKPALFSGVPPDDTHILPFPVFYQSRELKELGMETTKINNSRAIGILFNRKSDISSLLYRKYCDEMGI